MCNVRRADITASGTVDLTDIPIVEVVYAIFNPLKRCAFQPCTRGGYTLW